MAADIASDVLVATCGNPMAGDDAFGPLVGARLREMAPLGINVVDLDIKPVALLDHLPGPRVLILVDAARVPDEMGHGLLQWDLRHDPLPQLAHDDALSSHGMGLADQLELARQIGVLPREVHLVAAPIEDVSLGAHQGSRLQEYVRRAADLVVETACQAREVLHHA